MHLPYNFLGWAYILVSAFEQNVNSVHTSQFYSPGLKNLNSLLSALMQVCAFPFAICIILL